MAVCTFLQEWQYSVVIPFRTVAFSEQRVFSFIVFPFFVENLLLLSGAVEGLQTCVCVEGWGGGGGGGVNQPKSAPLQRETQGQKIHS